MRKIEIQEVLKFAIQVEEGAGRVYRLVAEKNPDPTIQKMAGILMKQEAGHQALFENWLKDSGEASPVAEGVISTRAQDVLDSIAKSLPEIKTRVAEVLAGESTFLSDLQRVLDPVAFVEMGIRIEETSILVYTKLEPWVSRDAKSEILRVINEERSHLKTLLSLKSRILDFKRGKAK